MSLQPLQVDVDASVEFGAQGIDVAAVRGRFSAGLDEHDIVVAADDRFGKQESAGQFGIVAGRAHSDGQAGFLAPVAGVVTEADFQRLFDREPLPPHRAADFAEGYRYAVA